jgi:hypothetical protein
MDAMNIEEVKKKVDTFREYHTYIFVRTNTSTYNGYVLSIHADAFMFMDDMINNPIPVRYDELKFMPVPSNKKGSDFNYGRRVDG